MKLDLSALSSASSRLNRLRFLDATVLLLLGCLALASCRREPALEPPVPQDLSTIEPQLRAYIVEKAVWVRQAPREAQRHATLGLVYAANGLWPEALLAFENAIRLDPQEPLAQLYRAISLQERGDQAKALPLLQQLTLTFPQFAPGFYRLGEAKLRVGAVEEARVCFERLITLVPGEWRGPAGLGEALLRAGDAPAAARQLEKAVQIDPAAKPAHSLLGQAYQRLGRAEEAQRELRLGLDAQSYPMPDAWSIQAPSHMKLIRDQIDIAKGYTQAGQPQRAVALLDTALRFAPDNLGLLNNLAIACNQAGQPQRGKALLLKTLQLNDRYLPGRVALVASCLALGQNDEALGHAAKAVELAPNDVQPRLAKANALLALERDAEAIKELETAARADPKNAQLHLEMGDIWLRNLDRPEEALSHYTKASLLDPGLAPAFVRLADVHLQRRNLPQAAAALAALRKLAPTEPALQPLEDRLRRLEKP